MPSTTNLRVLARTRIQQRAFATSPLRMSTNEFGQGKSHAKGASKVPESVQKAAPKGVEEGLPDSVNTTSSVPHCPYYLFVSTAILSPTHLPTIPINHAPHSIRPNADQLY
jgi:hypothetical protein